MMNIPSDPKDYAYWERNMLALFVANLLKVHPTLRSGWYNDDDNAYPGFRRVISINNGEITFHVPDDFEMGSLPQIEPNWIGFDTKTKWECIAVFCGVLPKDYFDKEDGGVT